MIRLLPTGQGHEDHVLLTGPFNLPFDYLYMLQVSRGVEESSSFPRYVRTGRAIVVQNQGVIRPS